MSATSSSSASANYSNNNNNNIKNNVGEVKTIHFTCDTPVEFFFFTYGAGISYHSRCPICLVNVMYHKRGVVCTRPQDNAGSLMQHGRCTRCFCRVSVHELLVPSYPRVPSYRDPNPDTIYPSLSTCENRFAAYSKSEFFYAETHRPHTAFSPTLPSNACGQDQKTVHANLGVTSFTHDTRSLLCPACDHPVRDHSTPIRFRADDGPDHVPRSPTFEFTPEHARLGLCVNTISPRFINSDVDTDPCELTQEDVFSLNERAGEIKMWDTNLGCMCSRSLSSHVSRPAPDLAFGGYKK